MPNQNCKRRLQTRGSRKQPLPLWMLMCCAEVYSHISFSLSFRDRGSFRRGGSRERPPRRPPINSPRRSRSPRNGRVSVDRSPRPVRSRRSPQTPEWNSDHSWWCETCAISKLTVHQYFNSIMYIADGLRLNKHKLTLVDCWYPTILFSYGNLILTHVKLLFEKFIEFNPFVVTTCAKSQVYFTR